VLQEVRWLKIVSGREPSSSSREDEISSSSRERHWIGVNGVGPEIGASWEGWATVDQRFSTTCSKRSSDP
jgi:hypothetical protein